MICIIRWWTKNREALWYCDVLGRLEKQVGSTQNGNASNENLVHEIRGLLGACVKSPWSLDIKLRAQSPDHRHSRGLFKSQTTKSSPPTPTPPNHLTNTLHHHRHRHRHLTSRWKVNSLENCVKLYDIYYMYLIYTYNIHVHSIHKL